MKSKLIIEKRLKEAGEAGDRVVPAEEPEKQTPFEVLYDKLIAKIDKKTASVKVKLYKDLLGAMVLPISSSGSNKTKLTVVLREFIKNFDKHSRG